MGKVYVVTDGCYSDYGICGIYSTKDKAEAARVLFAADNDVEEWDLDDTPDHPAGMLHYNVKMNRDGDSAAVEVKSVVYKPAWEWVPYGDGVHVSFSMWATDAKHAVKIANERRIALIASGEWTVDHKLWRNRLTGD